MTIRAYAARDAKGPLQVFEYEPAPLRHTEVELKVLSCGICHSDLSMLDNDWHMTTYPFVPGHEVIGRVESVGEGVTRVQRGQVVGLGWYAHSCLTCEQCMSGDHNLCASAEQTIVGRHGGFADRVRAHEEWLTPLPAGLDPMAMGPMFCGGITVFNPLVQHRLSPTARAGVIGIGGLGHLAIRFLKAWGCHVTAFSTSPDKEGEARALGAHDFIATRNADALKKVAGSLDLILVTVNVTLDWDAYIAALKPRGVLHFVGAAPSVNATVFPLIGGQKSISASPLGSPVTTARMIDFSARHGIAPVVEEFPMSRVNDALERLRSGKARYRVVLRNDFA